jgi:hypothetical protein
MRGALRAYMIGTLTHCTDDTIAFNLFFQVVYFAIMLQKLYVDARFMRVLYQNTKFACLASFSSKHYYVELYLLQVVSVN